MILNLDAVGTKTREPANFPQDIFQAERRVSLSFVVVQVFATFAGGGIATGAGIKGAVPYR